MKSEACKQNNNMHDMLQFLKTLVSPSKTKDSDNTAMEEDGETEKSPSQTELFMRPDGQPMYFLMNHNSSNNVLILKKVRVKKHFVLPT